MTRPRTPAEAWQTLVRGNRRFVEGRREHPNQDVERRHEIEHGQEPLALVFGCSDSRVAAEIIFDQGLGDMFVVRTAGHVIDAGVLGSVEYGVALLGIPVVVVLGHDSCGAVGATLQALDDNVLPGGYIRDLVERVTPSVLSARHAGLTTTDEVEAEHVRQTVELLRERSTIVSDRIEDGRLAVVGVNYALSDGVARLTYGVGKLGSGSPAP